MDTTNTTRHPKPAMTIAARAWIGAVSAAGLSMLGLGLARPDFPDTIRFVALAAAAAIAARLKVRLPGMSGTMSVNLPFVLLAVAELSLIEALLVACASAVAQSLPKAPHRFQPVQALFNFCTLALSAGIAAVAFHTHWLALPGAAGPVTGLAVAATAYFVGNTVPVAGILCLTEGPGFAAAWGRIVQWSFPYYLAGTGVTSMALAADRYVSWYVPLAIFPLMVGMYRSYAMFSSAAHAEADTAPALKARAAAAH